MAVDHINHKVNDGEFLTFLGPSGCGKTTTLRLTAGFLRPDTGEISVGGEVLSNPKYMVPPERRNMGMVFQSYALWPHMKVFDNVALSLKIRHIPRGEIRKRVREVLAKVQLEEFEDRYPTQLSGGQQQRVSLARALVYNPQVLLLDEPLSNLDAKLREAMRFELKELQRELKVATIYVSHDQAEAMVLSDRIAVMNKGKIEQVGKPIEIYEDPQTAFVAGFIGLTNFIEGKLLKERTEDGYMLVDTGLGSEIKCRLSKTAGRTDGQTNVIVSIRPENIALYKKPIQGDNCLEGRIEKYACVGNLSNCFVQVKQTMIRVQTDPFFASNKGDSVYIRLNPDKCVAIPER